MSENSRGSRYHGDKHRLPSLSLGLSSVRLIVRKLEAECRRAHDDGGLTSRELVKYNPDINNDFPLDPARGQVWYRFAVNLAIALSKCIPSVTFGNFGLLALLAGFVAPRMISYLLIYPFCRLVFGTLYPAYASYKAVRTKNLKEYVKWMMYWIVFALFTCTETITDVFLSWFPFYYEVKIVLVLWLLSPATKGSSILYRKFVHPALCRREQEIDEYIAKAKDQGYHTVLNLGTKGVNYATTVIMQTAIKGGGGLVQQIRKSYSLSDLTECDPREERGVDEADDVLAEPRLIRRAVKSSYNTRRSASESNNRSPMYFPEVDVDVKATRSRGENPDLSHIKSSEDISSGYSSADNSSSLARSSSARARARTAITAIKRPQAAEDSEVIIEELHDNDLEYSHMPPLVNVPSPLFLSDSDPPFIYQYVGDQIRIVQVLNNNPNITNDNQTLIHEIKEATSDHDKVEIEGTSLVKDNEIVAFDVTPEIDLNKDSSFSDDVSESLNRDDIIPSNQHIHLVDENSPNAIEQINNTENKVETDNKLKTNEIIVESETRDNLTTISLESETQTLKSDVVTKTCEKALVSVLNEMCNDIETPRTGDELKDSETLEIRSEIKTQNFACESKDKENVAKLDKISFNPELECYDVFVDNEIFTECEDEFPSQEQVTDTIVVKDDKIETASLSTSNYDNESVMSDDEASFGTPEDSPKSKRKSPKGKYGKGKAPSPPILDKENKSIVTTKSMDTTLDGNASTTSQESLVEMVNRSPNITLNETGIKSVHVNPIAEKKRRHKTKSPGTISKENTSGLVKLLQLPSKFVFWHKSDDKSKSDTKSITRDQSRRSSTVEKKSEEFQSCNTLNTIDKASASTDNGKAHPEFEYYNDAEVLESEVISHDILEKSDALQRLIEAKLESHPEYKIVSLHEDKPTTSKSTDV